MAGWRLLMGEKEASLPVPPEQGVNMNGCEYLCMGSVAFVGMGVKSKTEEEVAPGDRRRRRQKSEYLWGVLSLAIFK